MRNIIELNLLKTRQLIKQQINQLILTQLDTNVYPTEQISLLEINALIKENLKIFRSLQRQLKIQMEKLLSRINHHLKSHSQQHLEIRRNLHQVQIILHITKIVQERSRLNIQVRKRIKNHFWLNFNRKIQINFNNFKNRHQLNSQILASKNRNHQISIHQIQRDNHQT